MQGVDWIGLYLLEDVGPGDATSDALFPASATGRARIVARSACTVAGLRHAVEVFARLGAKATPRLADGALATAGQQLLAVEGPTRAILAGERLALNILGRMSGIATATRQCAQALAQAGGRAHVAATRKTTPGFRAFEKEAVVLGGGQPHRMGLWDEAMVKDNHIEALCKAPLSDAKPEQVAEAVRTVRAEHPGMPVCCEVESLAHAQAAAGAGADWLLIDNQAPQTGKAWAEAIRRDHPSIRIEASGGITAANVAQFSWADRVSLGALTQKSAAADVSLEWVP